MTDNSYADPQERIARFQVEVERLNRIVEARNNECNRLAITLAELRGVVTAKNKALALFADQDSWNLRMPRDGPNEMVWEAAPYPTTFARAALEKD